MFPRDRVKRLVLLKMTEQEKTDFFNEHYEVIKNEIEKRRRKWTLKAIPSLDFDDISQILMRHVYVKLHLYDKTKSPFVNWLNTLISNQIHNALRNTYFSSARPCLRCACCLPSDGCELYSEQTNQCPLFKHWEQTKKAAHDIKLPLPSETHQTEIFNIPGEQIDYDKAEKRFHNEMYKILKKHEWIVYNLMFIEHLTDAQIAKKMRWVSSEGRPAGYGNLARLKKIFLQKARKIREDVDLF